MLSQYDGDTSQSSWIAPFLVTTYLSVGFLCIKTPVRLKEESPIVIDRDVIDYEKARFFLETGEPDNVLKALRIFADLAMKGYYEILDILIETHYNGIPGLLAPDRDRTEQLFSLKTKSEQMYRSMNLMYTPRFPDAISTSAAMRNMRFTEIKEKAKFSVQSDNQNTHDSGVTGSIKATLEKLREVTPLKHDTNEAANAVRLWIVSKEGKLDKKQQTSAMRVLDKISMNSDVLQSVDMREAEILALIYNRINAPENEGTRSTMIENLCEELADSEDPQGYLYCTQGRISRMLNALNSLDTFVTIKPLWALRQEMLNDASVIKDKMMNSLPEKTRLKLEKNDALSDKFDENFRVFLRERYRALYVETGILKQDAVDTELKEWIDHI